VVAVKLVRKVRLEYREGNSDKVYEVDLCEVADGQFVVNFRYGRRGSNLKDGTKTTAAVSESRAALIFDDLVASKLAKGYRNTDEPNPAPQAAESSVTDSTAMTGVLSGQQLAVLGRLSDGSSSHNSWPLGRAVWKAGQLRLRQAEPLLIALVGTKDEMLDYCVAWALGQCGSQHSVELLTRLESQHAAESVRRIAGVALFELLGDEDLARVVAEGCDHLPDELGALAKDGPADAFQQALNQYFTDNQSDDYGVLEVLYLINNENVRPALLHTLRTVPLRPGFFQRLRHIFKAAELRRDAEVFGLLAMRFESTRSRFTMQPRAYYPKRKLPTLGAEPSEAYSSQTRKHLRRRAWRSILQLGECEQSRDFVEMAAGILRAFSDEDARSSRRVPYYHWDYRTRTSDSGHVDFDRYSDYFTFNQILYRNSSRYSRKPGGMEYHCVAPFEPGGTEPQAREEAFPEYWDRHPDVVLNLLIECRCDAVHEFGAKVLRSNQSFCATIEIKMLIAMLAAPYNVTTRLSFDLAIARFDPVHPDSALVLALANCEYQPAREQSFVWVKEHRELLLSQTEFVIELVAANHADTRNFARDTLRQHAFPQQAGQVVIGRLIARLRSLATEEQPVAVDVVETLLVVFGHQLRNIGEDVMRDLLHHEIPDVQRFAGDLVLNHDTFAKHPPDDVLQALLESNHEAVRGMGVQIIGNLPNDVLLGSVDLLFNLSRHELADIRTAIRSTVTRLAATDADFGEQVGRRLTDALLVPGAPDGVPSHTAKVLREDLREHLQHIPDETVWALLDSRSAPAQEVGGMLLATNVDSARVTVKTISRLGNHEILAVRESAWRMCSENVDRLRAENETAAKILDSQWEDTRQFAFGYFREHFSDEGCLPADVLISICDSVRPDTQQFGRELITSIFQDGHGEQYVVKLGEHPAESMQLFASGFLERHVSDNSEQLQRMAPFFLSVLCRVNRGRVAKDRCFMILLRESQKNEESARVAAEILSQVSATIAVTDRASAIETLLQIQHQYPSLATPLTIEPLEVRGAV